MKVLTAFRGIHFYGDVNVTDGRFTLHGFTAEFDSDVFYPDVKSDDTGYEFPFGRGQEKYQIHMLHSGDVLVLKDGKAFLCTTENGRPVVLAYIPVLSQREQARRITETW